MTKRVYVKAASEVGLTYSAQVHRHALAGMFKEWVFKTNNKSLQAT